MIDRLIAEATDRSTEELGYLDALYALSESLKAVAYNSFSWSTISALLFLTSSAHLSILDVLFLTSTYTASLPCRQPEGQKNSHKGAFAEVVN